jgi:hypothetical protein
VNHAILIGRLALLLVFATASLSKLRDPSAFRGTLIGFGVSLRATKPIARLLPTVELATAAGLIFQTTARWAAVAGVLLLALFISAITLALRQGRTLDCNCFGQLASAEIGPRTLLRNVVLLVVSALVVWKAPGSSLTAWTGNVEAANIVAVIAVVGSFALVIALLTVRHARPSETHPVSAPVADATGPTVNALVSPGVRAPEFRLDSTDGRSVALGDLLEQGLPTIILFASPLCHTCADLVQVVGRWNATMGDRITFAVIESAAGRASEFAERNSTPPGLTVLVESGRDVSRLYGMETIPAGLAIGPDGFPLGPPATGPIEFEQMVQVIFGIASEPAAARGG